MVKNCSNVKIGKFLRHIQGFIYKEMSFFEQLLTTARSPRHLCPRQDLRKPSDQTNKQAIFCESIILLLTEIPSAYSLCFNAVRNYQRCI